MSNGNNVTLDNNNAKKRAIPIGISDFKEIIEGNYCYVDKSLCVKELLDNKAKVTLLPRPRRFGKTLTLSMLRYFFEKSSGSHAPLFEKLAIAQHPEIMKHQGQYPVIFFTLKEAKQPDWESCYAELKRIIRQEYERHRYLLDSEKLLPLERDLFKRIMMQEDDPELYRPALKNLSSFLEQHHGVKPVVLIDEYDAPIHSGYECGYYRTIIDFMRSFLGAGLKDNNALNFAVMTGILRVAKESIFSGLNHLGVYTILDTKYETIFGFTQAEVDRLLQEYNLTDYATGVRLWYNGYLIGNLESVYNPWSILNFITNRTLRAYWVNTSDNKLIQHLVEASSIAIKQEFELLLKGEVVEKKVNDQIALDFFERDEASLWSFLLQAGYLSHAGVEMKGRQLMAKLRLPNEEVHSFYDDVFRHWIDKTMNFDYYLSMLKSLVSGDLEQFKDYFQTIVVRSLSSFDLRGDEQENFYHALVLGMLVSLSETHEVISNRESGFGRYDVMIIPKELGGVSPGIVTAAGQRHQEETAGPALFRGPGAEQAGAPGAPLSTRASCAEQAGVAGQIHSASTQRRQKPGIIIEFKKVNSRLKEDLELAATSALKQIEERQYQAQLEARGVKNIIKLAIVFEGKNCLVREAGEAGEATVA